MTQTQALPILIAGVGLTAALTFSRGGYSVFLIEPARVRGRGADRRRWPVVANPRKGSGMTLWAGSRNHLVHYRLRGSELFNLVAAFHSDRYGGEIRKQFLRERPAREGHVGWFHDGI